MYSIISVRNGSFHIDAEGYTDIRPAIVKFHSICETLWNADDLQTGTVIIANDNLFAVDNYREIIVKE